MARISTYQIDPVISDLDLLIGTDKDNPGLITKNFTLSGIAEYVIDKLIDPDATDFHIPVFRANGTRITDSIITQNAYPTGSLISVLGSFSVCCGSTLYGNNVLGADSNQLTTINSQLKVLGPVYDSTGTIGGSEQVLVSNEDGELVWENYQGTGLEYQSTWDAAANTPDLTAITLDGTNTGKYWVVNVEGTTDLGGVTDWKVGDWAIISQDNDDNVFWEKIDNSSVDGVGTTGYISKWTGPKALGDSLLQQLPYSIIHRVGTHNTALGTYPENDETLGTILNASFLQACTSHEVPLQFSTTKNVFPEGDVSLVRMTILGGEGFVGIGKNNPTERLDIAGSIKISSDIKNGAGSAGQSGQVLSSNGPGSGFTWVNQVQLPADNVTGNGGTNILPIWSDGPNSVLSNSPITTIYDFGNNPKEVDITTTSGYGGKWKFNGAGGKFEMTLDNLPTPEVFLFTGDNTGFYRRNFHYQGTLAIGRTGQALGATLDVGGTTQGFPAAWFRNGVVISNNPSGVTVDNTSMVVGAGDNDIISGSDNSMIVGKANQLTKTTNGTGSDQSAAIGSLNILTDASNSLAVGRGNTLIGTGVTDVNGLRSQIIGLNNELKNTFSSIVIGGENEINVNETEIGQNTHVFGYLNKITGAGDNVYAIGNKIDIDTNTGSNFYAFGSNIKLDSAVHGTDTMAIGVRNKNTLGYTQDNNKGLGNPALVVGAGSTGYGAHDALIITKQTGAGTNPGSRTILPDLVGFNFATDADAANAGIPQGALYQNQGVVQINRGGGSTTDPLTGGGVAQTTGTYTPQLIASVPSEWVISSYGIQQGKWVRTGNMVFCDFWITISASNISGNTGGGSGLTIQGWPYDHDGGAGSFQGGALNQCDGFDVQSAGTNTTLNSGLGNAKLNILKQNTAITNYFFTQNMQTGDLNNGNQIYIIGSFSYLTTDAATLNSGATIDS